MRAEHQQNRFDQIVMIVSSTSTSSEALVESFNAWQSYLFVGGACLIVVFGLCWYQHRERQRAMRILEQQRVSRLAVQAALHVRLARLAQLQAHEHNRAVARQNREFHGVCRFCVCFWQGVGLPIVVKPVLCASDFPIELRMIFFNFPLQQVVDCLRNCLFFVQ
jgi:hypothetical protein